LQVLLKAEEKDRAKGKEEGAEGGKWVASHLERAQDVLCRKGQTHSEDWEWKGEEFR